MNQKVIIGVFFCVSLVNGLFFGNKLKIAWALNPSPSATGVPFVIENQGVLPNPSIISSPTPDFSPISLPISPSAHPEVMPSEGGLNFEQRAKLKKNFIQFQYDQILALRHRLKMELDQFKQAQIRDSHEFEKEEKFKRKAFFERNLKGASRRAYLHDFLNRRKSVHLEQKQKLKILSENHKQKIELEIQEQKKVLNLFENELNQGHAPSSQFWSEEGFQISK